jgi:hypothetical protein
MNLFNWLFSFNNNQSNSTSTLTDIPTINPASGEPMIGGMGGIDTSGNCYGMNDHSSSSWSNDSFGSGINDF